MKQFTIFYKTKTYNQNRSYPQSIDRYVHSISVFCEILEIEKKIAELKENPNVRPETIRVFDGIGKCIY